MSTLVKVKLTCDEGYAGMPEGKVLTMSAEKAEVLVKRKVGVIEGKTVSYNEQDINEVKFTMQKNIDKMSEALEKSLDESDALKKTNLELENELTKEKHKVAFLENKLKRYSGKTESRFEEKTEDKKVDEPPVDKMIKGNTTTNKTAGEGG